MLSGGVVASMAMTADAFKQLEAYSTGKHGVFSPKDDVEGAPPIMHAVFCYGWWDNATNAEDGWWLCKNRCGGSLVSRLTAGDCACMIAHACVHAGSRAVAVSVCMWIAT